MSSLFPWIVGAICAPCFFVVIRLIDVTNTLRSEISDAQIWGDSDFPEAIADIENNPQWRLIVAAYYSDIDRINREVIRYLLTNIVILMGVLGLNLISEQAPDLGMETIALLQFGYCGVAVLWLLYVITRFSRNLRFKSDVEVTINAIRQPDKE